MRRAGRTLRQHPITVVALLTVTLALLGPLLATAAGLDAHASVAAAYGDGGLFGHDRLGRDIVARLAHGGAGLVGTAFVTSVLTEICALAMATALWWWQRAAPAGRLLLDVILVAPQLILMLAVAGTLGLGIGAVAVLAMILFVPFASRYLSAAAEPLLRSGHVATARAAGDGWLVVTLREIAPCLAKPMLADGALRFIATIFLIATASFLDTNTDDVTWAGDLHLALPGVASNPWAVLAPTAAIACITVPVGLLADRIAKEAT